MASRHAPGDGDLRALLDLLAAAREGPPGEGMPWAGAGGARALIGCDVASFNEMAPDRGEVRLDQGTDGVERQVASDAPEELEVFFRYYPGFRPCAYPLDSGDLTSVVKWSDFYTRRELLATPLHREYLAPSEHSIFVCVPGAGPGRIRRLLLWRDTAPDFTERDRMLLALVRPHLQEVWLDAERRRHGVPRLSEREWQVLELAGRGHSNADIARILVLSTGTVRKHMEHVFDRLGVRNRRAAAALALPHRPLRRDRPGGGRRPAP
jgi:DNA-binding CsgD family transcriptional regulator